MRAGPALDPSRSTATYSLSRWLFLRLLGVAFLIAFLSLSVQIKGLIGSRGVLPAAEQLAYLRDRLPSARFLEVPTLFWINSKDSVLVGSGVLGILLSLLLIAGITQRWVLLALWMLYLSFASVSGVFLGYQWDILLLETGLLAIFYAPGALWSGLAGEGPLSPIGRWLLRWLLFRLMFLSGLVKLLSGDAAWRGLTALEYHYWTQPLPTWVSYYVQHLPNAAHTICTALMFAIELAVPFLIFGTRRMRLSAAVAFTLFMLAVALTGNYGFFNLLAIILCVTLVDDAALRALVPRQWRDRISAGHTPSAQARRLVRMAAMVVASLLVAVSLAEMRVWRRALPEGVETVLSALQPFRSINSYGLFAIMTTTRPEIILEGSKHGREWKPYEFKWKPGQLDRPSQFVAPHQPRLDWQMWFAALGSCRGNPWFLYFVARLLEASPDVLALMGENPFPGEPPKYIRSTVYNYRFSAWDQWRGQHIFWTRELKGLYCPILTLTNGSLSVAHLAQGKETENR